MGETRRGWYDREEIEKITLDWVNTNCNLTEREMDILKLVYNRKLIRRDHLEVISDYFRNLGDNRTVVLNRSIRKMYRKKVLDKIHEEQVFGKGNSPSIVAVDKAGSILLNVPHKKRIIQKKEQYKDKFIIKRSLPINYKHINGVNELEVKTILFCDETNNQIINWELEEPKTIFYGNEKITIISDVLLEMIINNQHLYAYIEYDTGSENLRYKTNFPIIHDKLIKYKKYKLSNLWVEKYKYFPLLFFVTQDYKRVPYFTQKSKELGLQGYGIYHENYIPFLEQLNKMTAK